MPGNGYVCHLLIFNQFMHPPYPNKRLAVFSETNCKEEANVDNTYQLVTIMVQVAMSACMDPIFTQI